MLISAQRSDVVFTAVKQGSFTAHTHSLQQATERRMQYCVGEHHCSFQLRGTDKCVCIYTCTCMCVCVCVCVGFCAKDRLRTGAESVFLQNSILVCPAVTHFHLLLLCTLLPLCTRTHTHTHS